MASNNIRQLRKAAGKSQTELAEAIGTTLNSFGKIERGERRLNQDWINKIARVLCVAPSALIEDRVDDEQLILPTKDDENSVTIKEIDLVYGMGAGGYMDLPIKETEHTFSRDWIRHFTHSPPEQLFIATGMGDSMMPTILDSDMVLIDHTQREVRIGDKIWAVSYADTGYIKRLRPMPGGGVRLLSDNPNVPDDTAYDGELAIVGRVVAIIRKT